MQERPKRPDILEKMMSRGYENATSSPENDEYRRIIREEQLPRIAGRANEQRKKFKSPEEATAEIGRVALEKGADRVGFCIVDQRWVYDGVAAPYRYGIVLLKEMDYAKIGEAPAPAAGTEATRIYMELGEITVSLGEHIRNLGYHAMIHHPRGDRLCRGELLFIPHAISAGLGEHGRNGLLINHDFGPRVRLGMVTTNLRLIPGRPVDKGVSKFCEYCLKCYRTCPAGALPLKKDGEGAKGRFTIASGSCAPYFEKTDGCGICVKECVFNQSTVDKTRRTVDRVSAWYEIVKANPHWPEIT